MWLDHTNSKWFPMNRREARKASNPLTIYIISDNHKGVNSSYINEEEFTKIVNRDKPDAVLHLGDAIHGETTSLYDYETDREAAINQQQDWFPSWAAIDPKIPKEITLGNRDLASNYPLFDDDWIPLFGYENRPVIGGSKMQTSFIVDNGDVKALFIMISMYSEGYDAGATAEWAINEMKQFKGDQIIICSHADSPYSRLRNMIIQNYITTPVIFLHGHNHSADTVTRDTWGRERDILDFPCILMPNLFGVGAAVSIDIHKGGHPRKEGTYEIGGYHELKKINTNTETIDEPTYHYQTRV